MFETKARRDLIQVYCLLNFAHVLKDQHPKEQETKDSKNKNEIFNDPKIIKKLTQL